MQNFFWCPKVPGKPMGSSDFCFASVRQKNSTKYCDLPLLWIKIIDMSESSETLNGFPTKTLSTVSQKNSTDICVLHPNVHGTFRYQEVVKRRRVPLQDFLLQWDNIYSTENHDIPPLMQNFFWCPKVPKTPMGSLDFCFASVRQKISTKYCDLPLLWIKVIDMSENSETLNGFPTKTRSTVSQKISTENFISPHSVHKTFRYQKVVKHRTVPLRDFPLLWDKTIRQKITISYPSCKNFLMPKTSSNTNGFPWFLFH